MGTEQNNFSDAYARLQEEFATELGEEKVAYGRAGQNVREEIVRCIWFGGHFPSSGLSTDDGRRLEVISPGWWNVEGGPDFVRAELLLEGEGRTVGDVEVHTSASGWYAHGHDRQPEYNDVALHVVLWNDGDEPGVHCQDGRLIPQLTFSQVIEEDLEELVEAMGPEEEPPPEQWRAVEGRYCGRAYQDGSIDAEWLGHLLDAAGDHRILMRAIALADLFENHPREQLLYERLAEALGYKNNRMPFMQLAGVLPVATLRQLVAEQDTAGQKSLLLEALYFTVGGFLDGGEEEHDAETTDYIASLRRARERIGEMPTQVRLSPDHWHFGGTRPVNYPTRRMAALARFCAQRLHDGLFSHFLRLLTQTRPEGRQRPDVALRNAFLDTFQQLDHPYWSHRCTFGGKKLNKPLALVGRQRATSILVDVLLPMLLAHARAEKDGALTSRLHSLWDGLPRRQHNSITRRMCRVMFGGRDEARKVVDSTRRQQGLHQIYRDCCRTERGCERCIVYLAHKSGKNLARL